MPTIEQTLQRINRILDVRAGMTNSMIPAIKRDDLPEVANRIEGILARIIRQDSKAPAASAAEKIERVRKKLDGFISARSDANLKKEFSESDHPRGADGKFIKSGSASMHGLQAYKNALVKEKGVTQTPQGMAKYLIKKGTYSSSDIASAIKEAFGGETDEKFVKNIYKKLKNIDKLDLPPLPNISGPQQSQAPVSAPAPAPAPAPVSATPIPPYNLLTGLQKSFIDKLSTLNLKEGEKYLNEIIPLLETQKNIDFMNNLLAINKENQAKQVEKDWFAEMFETAPGSKPTPEPVASVPEPLKAPATAQLEQPQTPVEKAKYFPADLQKNLGSMLDHYANLSAENKPKVDAKIEEIYNAFGEIDFKKALENIQPIQGIGMSITTVNDALENFKKSEGIKPKSTYEPKSTYTPTTAAQVKKYNQLKGHKHTTSRRHESYEDSEGNDLYVKYYTSTKKIPEDFFEKTTSAYGNNPSNGNTNSVDSAMADYQSYLESNVYTWSQKSSLDAYQGSSYQEINHSLLNPDLTPDPQTQKWIDDISEMIGNSYLPADTPVFRGLKCSLKDLSGFDNIEDAIGRSFVHKNFASCSRSENTARWFGEKTVLIFTAPAGSKAALVRKQDWEREIVLPANTSFKITGVKKNSYGGHDVNVEYIGQKTDEAVADSMRYLDD